ncbi:type VI secretion system-associated protein TagF [Sansalvadorimonas sp. 2012CJ34-2]|uniref:Type VI secretion system-associated protein TagF n=1 Tax=Parendozoicomonas callyspongiae TaxID=2942213 RepID=A0ABT0PDP4_9GAMM|nr:type VI secretion system-associated protein TagF [Sansalvadorimonas sp. 2012CJ34-2]MCL6269341.1 type VI secretion system-associated protein TagF [Sansalvadorimonas sp. 2012CJ34-2]
MAGVDAVVGKRSPGFYGKLPAHGDFIDRGLPVSFISGWDEWLRQCVAASREIGGENWLNHYLTSPIWRFALTDGVINGSSWAGILVPSVDSVGRYYPVTVAMPLIAGEQPASFLAENHDLFSNWEQIALQALQENLKADEVAERLSKTGDIARPVTVMSSAGYQRSSLVKGIAQPADGGNVWARLLDASTQAHADSFSLWSCAGSACMPAMLLYKKGLPEPRSYIAMLNGQWQAHEWDSPL